MLRRYVLNILIAVDQGINAILGGDPDETISSRAAKRQGVWYWAIVGRIVEWLDPGHLARSIEIDEGGDAVSSAAANENGQKARRGQ